MKKFDFLRAFVLMALATVISLQAAAQDEEKKDKYADDFKEILFMVIDGDYEKAVSKSEKYMDKDATRRDPRPYIYASMAYFEISRQEEMAEDYPRAFREAIKYGYKARRYDKENEYMPEFDRYLSELKAEVMQEARYQYETENWRKSVTYAKYVNRIDPKDISALLLKGSAEMRGRNAYQAETTFAEAKELLPEFSPGDVSSEGKPAYLYAVIEYAKLMEEEGKKSEAMPYLEAMEPLLGDDPEFSRFMNSY
jgi:hypothetical protein